MTKKEKTLYEKLRSWGFLLLGFICIGLFISVISPWIQSRVPFFERMAQVSKERKISPAAYFYSETQVSHDSESYVKAAVKTGSPDQTRSTLPLAAGIFLFFMILLVGYKLLPP